MAWGPAKRTQREAGGGGGVAARRTHRLFAEEEQQNFIYNVLQGESTAGFFVFQEALKKNFLDFPDRYFKGYTTETAKSALKFVPRINMERIVT